MKLDKSIEILQFHYEWLLPLKDQDLTEATKLGIKALERLEFFRQADDIDVWELLPGETPDNEPP